MKDHPMKIDEYKIAREYAFNLESGVHSSAIDAIAAALRSTLPAPGEVLVCEGDEWVKRKVLGTLPILRDGSFFGGVEDDYMTEFVWAVQPTSLEVFQCHACPRWSQLDDWRVAVVGRDRIVPLSWCYLTEAAARAAAEAAKEKGAKK